MGANEAPFQFAAVPAEPKGGGLWAFWQVPGKVLGFGEMDVLLWMGHETALDQVAAPTPIPKGLGFPESDIAWGSIRGTAGGQQILLPKAAGPGSSYMNVSTFSRV